MREALSDLLSHRYPKLYPHGYVELNDGWFGILDALSEVVIGWAAHAGRKPVPADQIKEKFGTLSYYTNRLDGSEIGSVIMAEEMSSRICEITGRRGRLSRRGSWYATRAPGVDADFEQMNIGRFVDGRMGLPPMDFTAADMLLWRSEVLVGPVDVPAGWLDLVDGLLRQIEQANGNPRSAVVGNARVVGGQSKSAEADPVRVTYIGATGGALSIGYTGGGPRAAGLVAFAIAMSRRTDPISGDTGPVDDLGRVQAG